MDARARMMLSINHPRLLGYRSIRGLGSHFQSNIPESLDIGASAQVWLLPVSLILGRGKSWEVDSPRGGWKGIWSPQTAAF